jgi:ABC-type multidrug transport system fused ATPase/permease subunit
MYWFLYRRPLYFLLFIPSLVSSWIMTYSNLSMGVILDSLSGPDPVPIIKRRAFLNFCAAIAAAVFQFLNAYGWAAVGDLISIKIKRVLFKSMLQKDVEFFDTHPIGDLLTLLTEDVSSVKSAFEFSKAMQIRAIGNLVAAVGVSFSIDWRLSLFAIASTGLSSLVSRVFRNAGRQQMRAGMQANGRSLTVAAEAISNARVVFAFNRQQTEIERYGVEVEENCQRSAIAKIVFHVSFALSSLLDWGTVCMCLNLGCYYVMKGQLTAGLLFALSRVAFQIGMTVKMLLGTISQETKALEAAGRIFELVDEVPKVPPDGGRIIPDFRGDIELQGVWFKYPTRDVWVMKDVSMHISPGEIVAVVGHSGSGKSTLVQLLLRFYDVDRGRILLDGVDIRSLDPRWVHQVVGVVQQEPILFAMTVRENVCYGLPSDKDVADDLILRNLEAAQARNFVLNLPKQLDTLIGEKGSTLSGGQRQRVAIARTMIRDPVVMVTDEATSALDAKSEKKVQMALDEVMRGRSSIIIAHRLGTIRAAGMIYVFETGELVEQGTHDELLQRGGHYYTLVQRQLGSAAIVLPD